MTRHFFGFGATQYKDAPLKHCVDDIVNAERAIRERFGLSLTNAHILTGLAMTRKNVIQRMKRAIDLMNPGDSAVIWYSGHGAQLPWTPVTEPDGLQEVMCMVDFDWTETTCITDDELYFMLKSIPPDCRVTMVCDCCFSGGLPKGRANAVGKRLIPHGQVRKAVQHAHWITSFKELVGDRFAFIAASAEDEPAQEVATGGALTVALLREIKRNPIVSLRTLVKRAAKHVTGQTVQLFGPDHIINCPII